MLEPAIKNRHPINPTTKPNTIGKNTTPKYKNFVRRLPYAPLREGTASEFPCAFCFMGASAKGFGFFASRLQEGFDLRPGDKDFSQGFAGAKIAPRD